MAVQSALGHYSGQCFSKEYTGYDGSIPSLFFPGVYSPLSWIRLAVSFSSCSVCSAPMRSCRGLGLSQHSPAVGQVSFVLPTTALPVSGREGEYCVEVFCLIRIFSKLGQLQTDKLSIGASS